jgi:hypothetical protein
MTQMAVADIAQYFSAQHAMCAVGFFTHVLAVDGDKIAWPTTVKSFKFIKNSDIFNTLII